MCVCVLKAFIKEMNELQAGGENERRSLTLTLTLTLIGGEKGEEPAVDDNGFNRVTYNRFQGKSLPKGGYAKVGDPIYSGPPRVSKKLPEPQVPKQDDESISGTSMRRRRAKMEEGATSPLQHFKDRARASKKQKVYGLGLAPVI